MVSIDSIFQKKLVLVDVGMSFMLCKNYQIFYLKNILFLVFYLHVLFLQEVPFQNQIGFEPFNSMVLIDKSSKISIVVIFVSRSSAFIATFGFVLKSNKSIVVVFASKLLISYLK